MNLRRSFARMGLLASLLLLVPPLARAEDTIKVGIVGPFSGVYSEIGGHFKMGAAAYQALHGDKVVGHKVELVFRDLDGIDPSKARALTQELVLKDGVQYVGGFVFTPNALSAAPVLKQAKVPLVVFNAATSSLTQASPYIVRTSYTMWQNAVPAAVVARRLKMQNVVIAVSDFTAGADVEKGFRGRFEEEGGRIAETIRIPMGTTNFAPIMQRIKEAKPDGVFVFVPGGPSVSGFVKAFEENGLKAAGIRIITTGDLTAEFFLPYLGSNGLGIYSTFPYSVAHPSAENARFLAAVKALPGASSKDTVSLAAVSAFDGMRVIYRMIEATQGQKDPDKAMAAVKGMAWESPRGPVSIDPESRHIRQTVYLRVVDNDTGTLINREIDSFAAQGDPGFGK